MKKAHAVGDVTELPDNAFGAAALTWWAMAGLMLIEGTTLSLVAASYLYIRQNYNEWPPAHTPLPSLALPLVNLALMLLSVVPAWWAHRRAREHDTRGSIVGLVAQGVLGIAIMVLRYFECQWLNVRWDTNAYGSVAW